jgi:endo-1,4-beta-xylanase
LADAHGIFFGAAVASAALCSEPAYHETLTGEFNALTPENAMKFGPLCSSRGNYNFGEADAIVAMAEEHGMKVRGHTLVWHNQLPSWLTDKQWTRDELISILHEHIAAVVGHYRGRIWTWDVVNEAVEDDGSLRQTIWSQGIGPEYIEMAFRWAHEADPNALLFYNDYSGEGLGTKSDAIYALVADLRKRGVPIDGVGLQMHVPLEGGPSPDDVAANMKRLGAIGLKVNITEMDVRIPEPITEEKLEAQAQLYHKMLDVCLMAKNCTAFEMWGFTDSHSWIPQFFPGTGDALIFDGAYQPKPAFNEIMGTLADPAHFKYRK